MPKKILLSIFALGLLNGCSLLGAMPPIEYNNAIVETLNSSAKAIQETASAYNIAIPAEVSETSEINNEEMRKAWDLAQEKLNTLEPLHELESRDIEQQNAVRLDLMTYQLAAKQYLKRYEEVLAFYEEKTFTQDVNKVESLDSLLHTDYTTFIEANNGLVQTLDDSISK